MKTTGFLKKDYFGFNIFGRLFHRPRNKNRSGSLKELKEEVSNEDYREKVKFLIEQDLLLRYNSETVEKGLEDIDIKITAETPLPAEVAMEGEQTPFQEPGIPRFRMDEILSEEKQQEIWKVERRIPRWFKKPYQYNTQILLAFIELLGDGKSVSYFDLQSACRQIKTFEGNYNQMKNFGISNHAKVFEEVGGRVTLWEPVREFVKKEYVKSKRRRI